MVRQGEPYRADAIDILTLDSLIMDTVLGYPPGSNREPRFRKNLGHPASEPPKSGNPSFLGGLVRNAFSALWKGCHLIRNREVKRRPLFGF